MRHLASTFFEEESGGTALITVTSVRLSDDQKEATIFFTVFPEDKEKAVLDFAKRKRSGFKHYVKSKSLLGRLPFFDFEIDLGEKNRQKIDTISNNL